MEAEMCLTLKSCKLEEAFRLLRKTVTSPDSGMMVAGEYDGNYYVVNWATRKLSRITLGAYRHVSVEWELRNRFIATVR
jgi:hypothetical protein